MLFDTSDETFESEKERNLYYKFFAGYFLNELVSGFDTRLLQLCNVISTTTKHGQAVSRKPVVLSPNETHISFDNHAYLFADLATDRGEFADICLHDRHNSVLVAIEVKVHTDWNYSKDVISNETRLVSIEKQLPEVYCVPVLLITEAKWKQCLAHESSQHSNYRRLVMSPNCRTRVILWEELLPATSDEKVHGFLLDQLARPETGFTYRFQNGWFEKNRR